jgi:DNA-binding transcriptional LysR family regulator
VYFTDRGIEELADRRGEEEVTFAWLAERLRQFNDDHPDFAAPIEALATWLARLDDDEFDE